MSGICIQVLHGQLTQRYPLIMNSLKLDPCFQVMRRVSPVHDRTRLQQMACWSNLHASDLFCVSIKLSHKKCALTTPPPLFAQTIAQILLWGDSLLTGKALVYCSHQKSLRHLDFFPMIGKIQLSLGYYYRIPRISKWNIKCQIFYQTPKFCFNV